MAQGGTTVAPNHVQAFKASVQGKLQRNKCGGTARSKGIPAYILHQGPDLVRRCARPFDETCVRTR
eukprot:CAMPEP_0198203826 /NCGR_PEP_ID=MMETSP1445-20131203/7164_1 /TAXON_ID=36898 /ORGANISM="Pyramimonas sp., Strain CCMP2087" /LENGTH=65 /DNA_ID=CAMNT_0043875387 /DNA_START=2900 /DNA_END=3097 /DNA_ORIENTATION=+